MCLLVLHFQSLAEAPLLVAANREEFYARPWRGPERRPGAPGVVCGVDAVGGGTWLGINQHRLIVGVTNRADHAPPDGARSRGLLCLDLLGCASADEAGRLVEIELRSGNYAGANFLAADPEAAWVASWNGRLRRQSLAPGLHLLTNGDLNDAHDRRQSLARRMLGAAPLQSVEQFLVDAAQTCSLVGPSEATIVLRGADRGTVSSTLIAVGRQPGESRLLFAPGSPDRTAYRDVTPLVAELFGLSPRA